jgi:hypothetical protein
MNIELSSEESDALRAALESALSDLRMEVADTEDQTFREALKAREKALRSVLDRLGRSM